VAVELLDEFLRLLVHLQSVANKKSKAGERDGTRLGRDGGLGGAGGYF
jgi:hypothetical protein